MRSRGTAPGIAATLVLAALALLPARPASANVLELWAQADGGGMIGGSRLSNRSTDPDFFHQENGGALGGELGLRLFFLDLLVDHTQYANPGYGFAGSWTQFGLGLHTDWPVDNKGKYVAFVGFDAGFGVGTAVRVHLPLDNAQVSWKGFVGELRFGVDYKLTKILSVGVELIPAAHYLFKNDAYANQSQNQLFGLQGTALATFKVDWVIAK